MDAWGDHPVTEQNNTMMAGGILGQAWMGAGAHVAYWAGEAKPAAELQAIMSL